MKFLSSTVTTGISFGSALAMVISYANWHSIPWAILHGLFGWFYVIYYALFKEIPLNPTPKEGRHCQYRAAMPSFFLLYYFLTISDGVNTLNYLLFLTCKTTALLAILFI